MKLLIVRHGDPDYSIDSLTPEGLARGGAAQGQADEARCCGVLLLAARQGEGHFKSDAQRARQNGGDIRLASRVRRLCNRPGERGAHLFLGQNACVSGAKTTTITTRTSGYPPRFTAAGMCPKNTKTVCDGIDELLARHGYIHDGKIYRVERENSDTVVLFCHFGVECVLLSRIF